MARTTRELIEAAFADVSYPGDDNIADHQDCLECNDIRAFFRGKSWKELRLPELYGFNSALSLFTPQAFRYFLPGYMLATLGKWEMGDLIPYGIMSIGGYADETDAVLEERKGVCRMFTREQREAIAAYLRELSASGPPELQGDADIEFAIGRILQESAG